MRLWHKDLILVLPNKQLVGQWRECCAIAKNIKNHNFPNHILVNKIMDYPLSHFITYTVLIIKEMKKRGFEISEQAKENFKKNLDYHEYYEVPFDELFNKWHTEKYFFQCYHNLEEKYDCNGISSNEWIKVLELLTNKYQGKVREIKCFDPNIYFTKTGEELSMALIGIDLAKD